MDQRLEERVAKMRPEQQPCGSRSQGALPRHRYAKRLLDIVVALLCLVVLALPMVSIALMIRFTSRGPALFRQVRLGQGGQPFVMYKFRTMYQDSPDDIHRDYVRKMFGDDPEATVAPGGLYKLHDDPRLTPVGPLLRRTSLDELPQLINVVRGEMSLVGPRPALPWEAELFGPAHRARFLVPPGVTGLWQISGRNRLTMAEGLRLDLEYLEKQGFFFDLKILLKTLPVVLWANNAR
jgi:lipopolysaccharide/colanic/teichoic acid biosynthesis glycosyltransferase